VRVGRNLVVRDGELRFEDEVLGRVDDLALPGAFQRENALVALGMARLLGAPPDGLRRAVAGLRALPHRMEDLGVVRGHRVWDNGVSTTPDSTLSALESLAGPCVLLCGGRSKAELPLAELAERARGRVRCVAAFGESAPLLAERFGAAGVPAVPRPTLREALAAAFESAEPGDALLFSPACASFDAYTNFRERALELRALLEAMR
jgi:UDP-N-acetylmuramoylalanine--D-glutamate ligase